jgi:glycosyltransferase involved in cell wall biosynthesis
MHDYECIIVDDHSTDEKTREIAQQYAKKDSRFISCSLPDSKRGGNAARNYGLQMSRAEFVNFLDSDDLLSPGKLENQIRLFEECPSLDMVTCRHHWFHSVPGDIHDQARFSPPQSWLDVMFFSDRINGGPWSGCSPIWRKDKFTQIGGWNESIKTWQDRELNFRALLAGVKIKFVDEVLIFIRVGNWKRMSNTVYIDRYNDLIESLQTSRQYLIDTEKLTELRIHNLSERLYHTVKHRYDQKGMFAGTKEWFSLCRRFSIPLRQTSLGFLLLLAREAGISKMKKALHQSFTAYRKNLPPALPDLENPFSNLA